MLKSCEFVSFFPVLLTYSVKIEENPQFNAKKKNMISKIKKTLNIPSNAS